MNSKTELDHEHDEYKSSYPGRAYFPYKKRDVIDTWSVERNSPFRIAVITMHASKVCTFVNGPRLQHCVNMLWNDSSTINLMLHFHHVQGRGKKSNYKALNRIWIDVGIVHSMQGERERDQGSEI